MKWLERLITCGMIVAITHIFVKNVRGSSYIELSDPDYDAKMAEIEEPDEDEEDGDFELGSGVNFSVSSIDGNVVIGLAPIDDPEAEVRFHLAPAKAEEFGSGLYDSAKEARGQMPPL